MIDLPEKFRQRMRGQLGAAYDDFIKSYDRQPYKAIRVNTLKISVEDFKKISPFESLTPVPWEENGFYVEDEKAGRHILHAAGLYYVQEPSAMAAAPLLNVKAGERVLDLCSAPGGKGTQLAQQMCGEGIIVLNEINFSRAKILSQNVERLGITNAAVISENPQKVCDYFEGYFDKVLVDAPCSGEGMFLKEESAVKEWSEDNVRACANRQSLILDSAQKALKPNGLLVYSTCTFAPEEDEEQVENFLKKYPNFKLLSMKKLLPHECKGEGHFVALLQKTDGEEREVPLFKIKKPDKKVEWEWDDFRMHSLGYKCDFGNLHYTDETLYSMPKNLPELPFKILRAGLRLGEVRKSKYCKVYDFYPNPALAMALGKEWGMCFGVNEESAIEYLKGYQIKYDDEDNLMQYGWFPLVYKGYPLGWCKLTENAAKNHLPKGLRI
ncbi:MAG: RsmB/NOP family class I SAM-dependent RNA methyltransferase [Clostridia bacterium]|nr:RsmB/NOP family class I SAM-dependent RNA methyltransferase [Clostridia bacterium]